MLLTETSLRFFAAACLLEDLLEPKSCRHEVKILSARSEARKAHFNLILIELPPASE